MTWIAMRCNLAEDPAVLTIAKRLGVDEFAVVGRLHRLWSWFDQHTINGHADVTLDWVDRHVSMRGFAEMLSRVGWLKIEVKDGEECGITMPNFERYNAESARKRELARLRQSRRRHADVTQPVTQPSRNLSRKMSRLQDSTVHKKNTPIVPAFDRFWSIYPKRVAKGAAERAWRKLAPSPELADRIVAAVQAQAPGWTDPQFVPNPATWLNARRWEDELLRPAATATPARDPYAHLPRWCDACSAEHAARDTCPKELAHVHA